MEEWNEPAFDAPGAPQKWLVTLWTLTIVVALTTEYIRYDMSKKHSEAGKGDKPRPQSITKKEFDKRWDKIFGKKKKGTK